MVDQNSVRRKLRWGALEFYAKGHIDIDLGAKFGRWVTVDIFPVP